MQPAAGRPAHQEGAPGLIGAARAPPRAAQRPVPQVGHAGTLDPSATGLLIVCTGQATKLADSFQAQEKTYSGARVDCSACAALPAATAFCQPVHAPSVRPAAGCLRLGEATASYDADTPVSDRRPWEHITGALPHFERARRAWRPCMLPLRALLTAGSRRRRGPAGGRGPADGRPPAAAAHVLGHQGQGAEAVRGGTQGRGGRAAAQARARVPLWGQAQAAAAPGGHVARGLLQGHLHQDPGARLGGSCVAGSRTAAWLPCAGWPARWAALPRPLP